jgi:hypothetical protein
MVRLAGSIAFRYYFICAKENAVRRLLLVVPASGEAGA